MENFILLLPLDNLSNINNLIEDAIKKGDKVSINQVGQAVRIHFSFNQCKKPYSKQLDKFYANK